MPRRLNRPEYGWSLTYGREQRSVTDKFKDGYEKIKWDTDTSDWDDGKHRYFGRTKRKVFK